MKRLYIATPINSLKGDDLAEFQVAAADVNQDGRVSIADVSALTDMLLKK